jgi:poly(beta-D-mannuronate) lyase
VRDPDASFVDLAARRAELDMTTVRAALASAPVCAVESAPPPTGRMVLPNYYLNVTHGAVDPRYAAAEAPYAAMWLAVSGGASRYAAFADPAAAACVLDVLGNWADAAALLDYSGRESWQAWFMVEWAASAAGVALSVVRAEPSLSRDRRAQVIAWLDRVAHQQIADPVEAGCCNNHAAWRGLMAIAIGVIARDDVLFRYGIVQYRAEISRLNADGWWTQEMWRKDRALHYHNYAILPLVGIAEFAARQGYDLYAAVGLTGRTLHDAVGFLLRALDDPALITALAGEPQNARSLRPGGRDLAWMEAYRRRFPSPAFDRHLPKPPFEPLLGGSTAVYWRRAAP